MIRIQLENPFLLWYSLAALLEQSLKSRRHIKIIANQASGRTCQSVTKPYLFDVVFEYALQFLQKRTMGFGLFFLGFFRGFALFLSTEFNVALIADCRLFSTSWNVTNDNFINWFGQIRPRCPLLEMLRG